MTVPGFIFQFTNCPFSHICPLTLSRVVILLSSKGASDKRSTELHPQAYLLRVTNAAHTALFQGTDLLLLEETCLQFSGLVL